MEKARKDGYAAHAAGVARALCPLGAPLQRAAWLSGWDVSAGRAQVITPSAAAWLALAEA